MARSVLKSEGWIQRFDRVTVVDVARHLKFFATSSRVQCPVQSCRESGRDDGRPSAFLINGGRAAKCSHADCDWPAGEKGGGALQYVGSYLSNDPTPPRAGDPRWPEIRDWLDASGLGEPDPGATSTKPGKGKGDSRSEKNSDKTKHPVEPPSSPAKPEEDDPNAPPTPTPEEVRAARAKGKRWNELTREEGLDDVKSWLAARGLDGAAFGSWLWAFPRNVEGPPWLHHWLTDRDQKSPTYGRFTGRHLPQITRGYQVGVVVVDLDGQERRIWLRGVTPELNQPRLTKEERAAGKKDPPSKIAPIPGSTRGLVMATPNVVVWLQGKSACPKRLLIVEGETDFMAARAAWGLLPDLGIVGIRAGSWLPEHGKKIPADCLVLIGTDNDEPGDRYAKLIEQTLPKAQPRLRLHVPGYYIAAGKIIDVAKRRDVGDAWRDGVLPKDPQGEQVAITVPDPAMPTFDTPPSYCVENGHLYLLKELKDGGQEPVILCTQVPEVVETAHEFDSGNVFRRIAWIRKGHEVSRWMSGGDLADPNKIAGLGNAGLDVHPQNKAGLGTYFSAFIRANEDHIPSRTLLTRLGWHGSAFALGETWMEDPSHAPRQVSIAPDDEGKIPKIMLAYGMGSGDIQRWIDVLRSTANNPVVICSILIALSAPLLTIVGRPGFIWHLDAKPKRGKTPALAVAFSVFGCPVEGADTNSRPSGMGTWKDSYANLVTKLGQVRHLPVWTDDRNQNQKADDDFFIEVAYIVANGEEPGRNTQTGKTRNKSSWRTVMLSSGEGPLITTDENQGAHERILTCAAHPWTTYDRIRPPTEKLTEVEENALGLLMTQHFQSEALYGHLGHLYLHHLQRQPRTKIAQAASRHHDHARELLQGYSRPHQALYLATMLQAGELAQEAAKAHGVALPWDFPKAVAWLAEHLLASDQGADTTDVPTLHFRRLCEWCTARADSPAFVHTNEHSERHDSIFGIWSLRPSGEYDRDGNPLGGLGDLDLTPEGLRAWMREARIRGWAESRLTVEWGTRGLVMANQKMDPDTVPKRPYSPQNVKRYRWEKRYTVKSGESGTASRMAPSCIRIPSKAFEPR